MIKTWKETNNIGNSAYYMCQNLKNIFSHGGVVNCKHTATFVGPEVKLAFLG